MADMMMLQGAITGLKTAGEIAKRLLQLKAAVDIQAQAFDLQRAILDAQESALAAQSEQSAMIYRIRELEEEIASQKAWEGEKERYQLTTPSEGLYVYALKESSKQSDPPHWICEHCYQDRRKSILHTIQNPDRRMFYLLKCSHCSFKSELPTKLTCEYM